MDLLRKFLRLPLVAIAYLSFALGGGICGTLIMPWLHVWPGTRVQKQRRCQWLTGKTFQLFHWYLYLIGVMSYRPPCRAVRARIAATLEEARKRGRPSSVMVVANHPTLIDTTAIMATFPYLIVMAKPQVFRFPLLNTLLRLCGHTSASADLGGEAALAESLIQRMKNGESVLLFPEATRSPDEGPRPFRRGPFEIALRAGAAIQPIVIESGPGLLKGDRAWYHFPLGRTRYELEPLDPVFPPRADPISRETAAAPESAPARETEADSESAFSATSREKNSDECQANWTYDEGNQPTSQPLSGRQLAQRVFDQISSALTMKPVGRVG